LIVQVAEKEALQLELAGARARLARVYMSWKFIVADTIMTTPRTCGC